MKKHKSLSVLVLSGILLLTLLTGCSNRFNAPPPDNQSPATPGTMEIIDMEGRKVVLNGEPKRIIAIGSALRLYTYVAGTEKLTGVERGQQSAASGRPYIMANPSLQGLSIVGEGYPKDPDPELLLNLSPDVIIAGDIIDKAGLEELQAKIGIPVVIVYCGTNAVFDPEAYEALRIIGQLTGMEGRAKEVIQYMRDCKQELIDLTRDIPEEEKPTVYVGGLSYKGAHGIESTVGQSPLLTVIGAKNVTDELGTQGSVMIDKEQLVEWDPDIIIIDENGFSIILEDYKKNPKFYNSLSAVKKGKVYGQLPYVSYYNNVETALANIYYVGKLLYPEAFRDIDPAAKADEIYTFLLGQPLYAEMSEKYGGYQQITLQ